MSISSGSAAAGPAAPGTAARDPVDPRAVLSSIGEVVYEWDIASDMLRWGPNASDVLGAIPPDCLTRGLAFARLIEPGAGRSRYEAIMDGAGADLGDGVPYRTRYVLLVGQRKLWADDTGRWFAGIDGAPARARGVLRLDRALDAADSLNAGPSMCDRAALVSQLDEMLAGQAVGRRAMAVLVVAIDDLGRLNHEFGHEATDEILTTVQDRIRSAMRRRDRLVRYSSNRFAIVLGGCPAEQIETAAKRFVRAVSRHAIETRAGVALVRIRVGAVHAGEAALGGRVLAAAERALDEARGAGLEHVVVTRLDLAAPALAGAMLEQAALAALNGRQLRLARQPVVEAGSRRLAFHEGLARLADTDGRELAPSDLMPLLERRGLIRLFDHRVLEIAAEGLAAEPDIRLAINVSPLSLGDSVWRDAFGGLFGGRSSLAQRLIVEVTETAAIAQESDITAALAAIKDTGARVALDDFGAGHTSLRTLRALPVDILKFDGAFTQNLARSTDDRFFVRTLIDLAQHLGLETVAEWVDSEAAARMLTEWGVSYLQGHLIGAATPWTIPGPAVAGRREGGIRVA